MHVRIRGTLVTFGRCLRFGECRMYEKQIFENHLGVTAKKKKKRKKSLIKYIMYHYNFLILTNCISRKYSRLYRVFVRTALPPPPPHPTHPPTHPSAHLRRKTTLSGYVYL